MSIFNWVIALSPADTGLLLEVDAVNGAGFPNGPPWPKTTVTEIGNGFYIFSDLDPPRDGYLLARLAGGGSPLAMRGITAADVLNVQPDGSVLVGSIQGDVYGSVYGNLQGDLMGRVVGYYDPTNDPSFGTGSPFWGPGLGDVAGRALGDTSGYAANGLPIPPFVGPGVHLDPDDPALPPGGGGDPATLAAAVWDRLTSLLLTPGSIGAFLLAKLAGLGSVPVLLQNALSTDGATIRVIIGDSYEQATAGRYAGEWLDSTDQLAGRPITGVTWETNVVGLHKTPTLDTVSGHVHVALELSRADTVALSPDIHPRWALVFTLSDGDQITWARGVLIPKRRT